MTLNFELKFTRFVNFKKLYNNVKNNNLFKA